MLNSLKIKTGNLPPPLIIGLSGALYALAMPPLNLWPLALIAFYGLLTSVLHAGSPVRAAMLAGLFFFIFHCIGLHWISNALLVDWQAYWVLLPLSYLGLPLVLALFPALSVYLSCRIVPQSSPYLMRWAVIITALILSEIMRSTLFTGFPWNIPAHIWAPHWPIAQAASMITVIGVSILTVTLLGATALIKTPKIMLGIMALCLLSLLTLKTPPSSRADFPASDLVLVQPNIPQDEKWSPNLQPRNLNIRFELTQQGMIGTDANTPNLIIWPETALSFSTLAEAQTRIATWPDNTYLLTGYLGYENAGGYYNAAILLNNTGQILRQYKKFHLVPFGEYIPFADIIPIGPIVGIEGFQKGNGPEIFDLSEYGLPDLQPLICYEAIFPRNIINKGESTLLVNLTNDAWYGNGWGPRQHLSHVQWRTLESGKPMIRVAGTGISASIQADGDVADKINYNTKDVINIKLP